MKILYQTVPSFFDLEISLIRELTKIVDLKVLMIVSPESMHSSAFSIDKLDERCDIIPATEYRGLEKYANMINLNDWYIANNPDNSILHGISLAKKIRKFYNANGFTFLHSTTDCKTAIMYLPYAWMTKHTLFTTHDPVPHKKPSLFRELVRHKLLYTALKHHLFLSDALVETFCKKYKVPQERIHYSRLSVYDFLRYYKVASNKYGHYLLFFGRIDHYKGVDLLIDAYEKSEARKNGLKLVIAGRGHIAHDISKLADDIILLNKYIDNEELANLIHHCSFVVLPYLSATQSGCVMSAFAFNKPIIATRVGDLPKEVVDEETGLICNPNDIEDLKTKIDKMASADLLAFENRIKNKYEAGSIYSWEAAAQSIVNAYKQICNNG